MNPKTSKSERACRSSGGTAITAVRNGQNGNAAEINAITSTCVEVQAEELPRAAQGGNARGSKQIIESVGCFGCHAIGPIQGRPEIKARHGETRFNLANQGSQGQRAWIYNWVKDPAQVWPQTKMPSLRFDDDELRM